MRKEPGPGGSPLPSQRRPSSHRGVARATASRACTRGRVGILTAWAVAVGCLGSGAGLVAAHAADPVSWPIVRQFEPGPADWDAGHRGVDLTGQVGEAVLAARGGVVTFAEPLAGRGVVVISHGETRTTYEPVTAAVRVGQTLGAGELIGWLEPGHDCATGACLHLGLRTATGYLDPAWLLAPTVRLIAESDVERIAAARTVAAGDLGQGVSWHPIFGQL